jgi:hypothetical protein
MDNQHVTHLVFFLNRRKSSLHPKIHDRHFFHRIGQIFFHKCLMKRVRNVRISVFFGRKCDDKTMRQALIKTFGAVVDAKFVGLHEFGDLLDKIAERGLNFRFAGFGYFIFKLEKHDVAEFRGFGGCFLGFGSVDFWLATH